MLWYLYKLEISNFTPPFEVRKLNATNRNEAEQFSIQSFAKAVLELKRFSAVIHFSWWGFPSRSKTTS